MSGSGKQTIYIDIDDEITTIIDKVKSSSEKIVALVLPKRATVLQSIVNMKLLKKSAQSAKKSLVLITSEAGLMPLAGAVGLHVAATLQSKPMVPRAPERGDSENAEIVEDTAEEPEIDRTKSVGELAGGSKGLPDDDTETIELDDEADEAVSPGLNKPKSKLKKVFKVPNFDRFRLSFFLAILAVILLVGGWIFAAIVLPKANITIVTDTSTNVSNFAFTASTVAKDLDLEKAVVPAQLKEIKKTDTEKTTASGKKDNGTKASGTITIKNCEDSSSRSVAAGTVFTASGKNFVSTEVASVPAGTFSGGGSNCTSGTVNVPVTAAENGDSYNVAAATYTTQSTALSGNFRLNGSAMSGGTSKIVTVVSQEDIDTAAAKMKGRLDAEARSNLVSQLKADGYKGLLETVVIGSPAITAAPALNEEATGEVTVTSVTTYTILGVKSDYLGQLIKKNIASKIDTKTQSILDDGLDQAVIRQTAVKSPQEVQLSIQTLVVAGPQLDANAIKDEIKGKKRGDTEKTIKNKTGVKEVTVTYSPFWVYATPKSTEKITVTIEKPAVNPTEEK